MNRPLTALFAALEALLVVGIGIGIPLVPLTFLWGFQYGLQVDWTVFWRASADVWLLGHGTDVLLTLDPVTAAAAGFEGAGTPFVLSIAPLGFALLTVLLALRTGRRIVETPHGRLGIVVALLVFAGLTTAVTLSALHRFARPSIWQGILWPTLVFAIGLVIGAGLAASRLRRMPAARARGASRSGAAGLGPARSGVTGLAPQLLGPVGRWWASQPPGRRTIVVQSLRGGTAAAAIVTAVSAIIATVLIALGYGQLVALYESIHAGVLGGIALTLGQLAFVPNLVVWASSWLLGPGFAIGAGSSVNPLATNLGPVPAIPVLGAVPTGDLALGFLGLLVPVVAGFLAGVAIRPALLRALGRGSSADRPVLSSVVLTGVGVGVVGGVVLGFLAAASGGAAGPGRLQEVGPDALLVGLLAAAELGIPAIIGLLTGRPPRP
jgi:hypothetical protein